MVADADPTNLDGRDRLQDARRQLDAAALLTQDEGELPDPTPGSPPLLRHPKAGQILHIRREVNAVAFSPDGRRLATASADQTARIWMLKPEDEPAPSA